MDSTRYAQPISGAKSKQLHFGSTGLHLRSMGLVLYLAATSAGGCHVPSPAGRIDGGSVFGQYRRMTR